MKTNLKAAPLRKVIGTLQVEAGEFQGKMLYYTHELYECFHHEMPKQDFIGEYHAARRRCRQCATQPTPTGEASGSESPSRSS